MISLADRQHAVDVIYEAIESGSRVDAACREAGIDRRTFRRWTNNALGTVSADARPTADRPSPSNRLSTEERSRVLDVSHEPRFADAPPSQIVPVLADEGTYLCSESTWYRVLHQENEQHERGRARKRTTRAPATHCATAANRLWSWDVTFLTATTRGIFFYLYMIMDVWSRKIVGFEVYDSETGELSLIHI